MGVEHFQMLHHVSLRSMDRIKDNQDQKLFFQIQKLSY